MKFYCNSFLLFLVLLVLVILSSLCVGWICSTIPPFLRNLYLCLLRSSALNDNISIQLLRLKETLPLAVKLVPIYFFKAFPSGDDPLFSFLLIYYYENLVVSLVVITIIFFFCYTTDYICIKSIYFNCDKTKIK